MKPIMKRLLLGIWIVSGALGVSAQELSWQEQRAAVSSTLDIIEGYERNCTLEKESRLDTATIARFRALFAADATLPDPFHPELDATGNPQPVTRSIDAFIAIVQKQSPRGLPIIVNHVYTDYDSLDLYRRAQVVISREIQQLNAYQDTITLHLAYEAGYQSAKITHISGAAAMVSAPSPDRDGDGVPDAKDACPDDPYPTYDGCPPPPGDLQALSDLDADGVADKDDECPNTPGSRANNGCPREQQLLLIPSISLGNMGIGLSGATYRDIAYEQLDEDHSSLSTPTENGGSFQFGAGVDVDYFLAGGFGFSAGLHYLRFSRNLSLSGFSARYLETDQWDQPYQRLLNIDNLEEEAVVSFLAIPLNAVYQLELSGSTALLLRAGAVFGLPLGQQVSTTGTADYEAIYQYNPQTGTAMAPLASGSSMQLEMTQESGKDEGYFESRANAGYDVAINTPLAETEAAELELSIMGQLQAGVLYDLNGGMGLYAGGYALFGSLSTTTAADYAPSSEVGRYSSLLNWTESAGLTGFGLKIGLAFGL